MVDAKMNQRVVCEEVLTTGEGEGAKSRRKLPESRIGLALEQTHKEDIGDL